MAKSKTKTYTTSDLAKEFSISVVSVDTVNKFIHNGLPVANIGGMKLIGKETALNFLRDHEELI